MPEQDAANSDKSAYIVNLSTINKLAFEAAFNKFAGLYYNYSDSLFNRFFHFKLASVAWVHVKYHLTMKPLIDEYKLGKIDTKEFLNQLKAIFDFIPAKENPEQLLKDAWNSLITWDTESTTRLEALCSKDQPIYFISNTNPLNIEKIINFFRKNVPEKNWEFPRPEATEIKPLKIAENFYLFPSYLTGEFKKGTPGLIAQLKDYLLAKKEKLKNLLLNSQFNPDLDMAKTLGIKSEQPDKFFHTASMSKPYSSSQTTVNNQSSVATEYKNPTFSKATTSLFSLSSKSESGENLSSTLDDTTPLLNVNR